MININKGVNSKLNALMGGFLWRVSEITEYAGTIGADLHHELFNVRDFWVIDSYAEQALAVENVWDGIRLVREYEIHNFGEMFTPIEPCRIANMVAYIVGQYVLSQSKTLKDECWNDEMTEQQVRQVQAEVLRYLRSVEDEATLFEIVYNEWC